MTYHGYLKNMNSFSTGNVRIYDAVSMIHGVIKTVNPFPYTAKFIFFCVRNNKAQ